MIRIGLGVHHRAVVGALATLLALPHAAHAMRGAAVLDLGYQRTDVAAPSDSVHRMITAPGDSIAEHVDAYMQAAVGSEHFSGSILVARSGRPLVSRGYGMANYELGVSNTPSTRFRIASLTKAFTAAAILLLQERGKLQVTEAVCRYVASCPAAWQALMLQQLLTLPPESPITRRCRATRRPPGSPCRMRRSSRCCATGRWNSSQEPSTGTTIPDTTC